MQMQKRVFVAGASGDLGHFLVQEYQANNWHVTCLLRTKRPDLPNQIVAQATDSTRLKDSMANMNLVVLALGIAHQRDGLTHRDVDCQANKNLLDEAVRAKLPHFCHIHVLNSDRMSQQG